LSQNYFNSVIERGLLTLFIQSCERHGGNNMSIGTEILKEGVATAEAIQKIRNTFEQNQGNPMLNPMASIVPPLPIPTNKKSPRAATNESMLTAENGGLKDQLLEKDEEIKRLNTKLGQAYQVVEQFRETFVAAVEDLNGKVFDVQSSVYEVLSGSED